MESCRRFVVAMGIRTIQLISLTLFVAASRPAGATDTEDDGHDAQVLPADTARTYELLPFAATPRTTAQLVTGHLWGGYDGSTHEAIGEAVVDGRVTQFLALRVGATSSDLWGRSTAVLGASVGVLREGRAPLDLGVGVVYQPQSIRGDGIVTGTVALGKTIGRLSSQASLGYGQDPEGDDGLGVASLGAVFSFSDRIHGGFQGRTRAQLWSGDPKFVNLERPVLDFSAGPVLACSLGAFDVMAYGGVAGLMLKSPADATVHQTKLQMGPMTMLGIGAAF
jgi:hypothetical protein